MHGREIVDAETGERIAWAFLVRDGNDLELEEFFVWPTHRRKGYGRELANLVLELVRQTGRPLKAWVPFPDASAENRPALLAALRLLGLYLHPSPHRFAAFCCMSTPYSGELVEPHTPERPASMRANLADAAIGTRLYKVWFGTNRKPNDANDASKGFSANRDKMLRVGTCKVAIPKSHRFGSVGTWWKKWLFLEDDTLRVLETTELTPGNFWRDMGEYLASQTAGERQGLVFLHGFNVDFEEAAIRAAQIGFDLSFPGVTAFYSWPSQGVTSLLGYKNDEACIEGSEEYIVQFLREFLTQSGVEKVHLIAHSMGNRGLLRSMNTLLNELVQQPGIPIGQIILAAADVDADLFRSQSGAYLRLGQRTTMYASPADLAVWFSANVLHGYSRVGLTPPVTVVPGIDTVNVPSFDLFNLGHGYVAEAAGLLHDIFDLIRRNAAPTERQRLRAESTEDGQAYWEMSR